jgi:DNA-binding HxlR family transcriptional regulator
MAAIRSAAASPGGVRSRPTPCPTALTGSISAIRPRRRHELRSAIGGISDKVLTETLRRLARHGLIVRHIYAEAPPRVEYALTRLGQSLADGPMRALGRWITEYGDELLDAQERS